MGRVVHFEITANDTARARKFYEIFGWKTQDSGVENVEYFVAKTGDDPMGIDGAIMLKKYRNQPTIIWISVDDLDDMIEKVKAAGGSIVGEKQHIEGIGDTIYASDTEGNVIGMIKALPRQG